MIRQILKTKRGSAVLLLSSMVSVSVLWTIYLTEKSVSSFLSDFSQTMEEWEKHLVTQSAQVLAGYLISNNLILCREGGWRGKNSKCQWNTQSGRNPKDFFLLKETDSSEGLSYKGKYSIDGSDKHYAVTFDLVNWKKTDIKELVGEIPEYICRQTSDMSVIDDAVCPEFSSVEDPSNQPCQKKGGADLANSRCEYIGPVDSDYFLVLAKVEVPFTNPVSGLLETYTALSGVRRPISMVIFQSLVSGRRCSMSCDTGSSLHFAPDCRADTMPSEAGEYTGLASKLITIKNVGPGSIYQLSILKFTTDISNGVQQLDVTPEIIQDKEVLFPGETLQVEDFYECPITVRMETVYRTGTADAVNQVVRNSIVPFQRVSYSFHLERDASVGACYSSPDGDNTLTASRDSVDVVTPVNRGFVQSAVCSNGVDSCAGEDQQSGTCQYAMIEPSRLFASPVTGIDTEYEQMEINIRTVITTAPPPPPPPVPGSPGGGGGGGGVGDEIEDPWMGGDGDGGGN